MTRALTESPSCSRSRHRPARRRPGPPPCAPTPPPRCAPPTRRWSTATGSAPPPDRRARRRSPGRRRSRRGPSHPRRRRLLPRAPRRRRARAAGVHVSRPRRPPRPLGDPARSGDLLRGRPRPPRRRAARAATEAEALGRDQPAAAARPVPERRAHQGLDHRGHRGRAAGHQRRLVRRAPAVVRRGRWHLQLRRTAPAACAWSTWSPEWASSRPTSTG